MKTLLKRILVLAIVLGTSISYANEYANAELVANYIKKGSSISVSDVYGEMLYSGTVNYTGTITKLFDFSQLKNGTYTLEIIEGYQIKINTIKVENHKVTFLNTNQKVIYKPVVKIDNDVVFISKLALNKNKMNVKIYFEDELIYSDTLSGEKILNRIYKLNNKLKGNYTTVINTDNRVFVENFKL